MNGFWNRLESNPRFFAFFWGALGSFAVWLIVECSGDALLFLGSGVLGFLSGYIDSRYARAAVLQNTAYSYFILSFIFVIAVVAWSEVSSKIASSFKDPKPAKEYRGNKPTPKWVLRGFWVVRFVIWIYLAMALLFLAGESVVLNTTSDFNQHMRIIAPYIDEEEEEIFLSRWSQMNSLSDYNEIYLELISVAKVNGFNLKRNGHD